MGMMTNVFNHRAGEVESGTPEDSKQRGFGNDPWVSVSNAVSEDKVTRWMAPEER